MVKRVSYLDDSFLSDDIGHVPQDLRVLGVVENLQTQVYSIPNGEYWGDERFTLIDCLHGIQLPC